MLGIHSLVQEGVSGHHPMLKCWFKKIHEFMVMREHAMFLMKVAETEFILKLSLR